MDRLSSGDLNSDVTLRLHRSGIMSTRKVTVGMFGMGRPMFLDLREVTDVR